MARPKSPLKAWLTLSLMVLLLHLALLQAVPLNLSSVAASSATASFAMRTISPEPLDAKAASATPLLAPKPATIRPAKRPPQVAPENTAQAEAETEAQTSPHALPAVDAAAQYEPSRSSDDRDDSSPEPTPTAAHDAASAPPQPEPEATPTPRAPRQKAASYAVTGVPGAIKLIYNVQANKFPYTLSGELLWAHGSGHYQARLSFGAFGQSRVQTSRGLIGPEGLMPERFSDKFRSEMAAHFNREQGRVTFSANTPDAALLQGAQDRLSILVQLAAMVASAPEAFGPATTLTLQTVGPRDADLWLFTVGNIETLELPGGSVQALKLTRNPRQAYDQQVDIWLAPSLGYLPARIRLTEANGDYIDQQWVSSEPASMP